MSANSPESAPAGVTIAIWVLALAVAAVGVIAAIGSASLWPLVALAGLFLPMLPVGRAGRRPADDPRSRTGA